MEATEVVLEDQGKATEVKYGGFWKRALSYIVDFFVLLIPIAMLQYLLFGSTLDSSNMIWGQVINIGAWGIYYVYCETSSWQATLGKRVLGLKVTDLNGNKISAGQAITRYLMIIPACLLLFVGIFMIAFTEKKQGLHDKVAKALIIEA